MDETIIVVTGASPLTERALAALPDRCLVLAADGGLDHALAAGLRPSGLIGDLDSVSADGLAWAEEHATISRADTDKDQTDTELALAVAADLNPQRIILIAGGGDRLDHLFAAVGALGAPTLTSVPDLEAWWGDHRLHVVHGPGRTRLDVAPGTVLSVLATHGPCTGVSISGVRWPLESVQLAPLIGHGVSNVADSGQVDIAVSSGVLTVIIPPDDTPHEEGSP
jgi:thiamine pyrophosphokinase